VKHTSARLAIALALGAGATAAGDTITLRSSVRLPGGLDAVVLADVAVIEGPEAQRHADLVIAEKIPEGAWEIEVRDVRNRLTDAGAHWGRLNLNGRKVVVRSPRSGTSPAPKAMAALSVEERRAKPVERQDREGVVEAATITGETTLLGLLARQIADQLRVEPGDLRLRYDRTDQAILAAREQDFRFEIQPLGSFAADRVEFAIRFWRDARVAEQHTLALRPLIRWAPVETARDLPRPSRSG
jgi:hypothetical protein